MKLLQKATARTIYSIKKHPGIAAGVLIGTLLPRPAQDVVKAGAAGAAGYVLSQRGNLKSATVQNTRVK